VRLAAVRGKGPLVCFIVSPGAWSHMWRDDFPVVVIPELNCLSAVDFGVIPGEPVVWVFARGCDQRAIRGGRTSIGECAKL
jgi:hypothetical protein